MTSVIVINNSGAFDPAIGIRGTITNDQVDFYNEAIDIGPDIDQTNTIANSVIIGNCRGHYR